MPPQLNSRNLFCVGLKDAEGRQFLSERAPYRYVSRADNRFHTVQDGESIFSLAYQYFPSLSQPELLYWVIADFQPEPILDVSVDLVVGSVLVIPSVRLVQEEIFNETRRAEFEG